VLQVRSDGGNYSSFATSKGLTISADIGQAILSTTVNGPVTVSNLPAGQQFTLRGFLVGPRNLTGPIIQVSGCSGRVVLHSLEVGLSFPSVSIQSSAGVLVQESRVLGGFPSVSAQNSYLECVGSTLQGGAADDRFNQQSAPAAALRQCRAVFTACQVAGGIGRNSFGPAPALDLVNSSVDAGAVNGLGVVRAGPAGILGTGSAPAVTGQNSSLRLDQAMPLLPTGSAPPVVGVNAANALFPGLVADTRTRAAWLSTRDLPGTAQVFVIGVPADPRPVPGIAGNLWIDQTSLFVSFPVPGGIAMPNAPYGTVFAGQVAALSPAGIELSNVAMLVVR
jgi:hypothetical protein